MVFDLFGTGDPFDQDVSDVALAVNAPLSSISKVQSPGRPIWTAVVLHPRVLPAYDKIEQHALPSIFADGNASEVLWNSWVDMNRDQMPSRTHTAFVWHEHRALHTIGVPC